MNELVSKSKVKSDLGRYLNSTSVYTHVHMYTHMKRTEYKFLIDVLMVTNIVNFNNIKL